MRISDWSADVGSSDLSVGLSAYASHVAVGAGQAALLTGAAIAFGHGLALAALSRQARRRMAVLALAAILAGTLLFSGGLVVAHFTGAAARTAPFGGSLLLVAWLAWEIGRAPCRERGGP